MKTFSLSIKFYLIFCLVLVLPAKWLATLLKTYIESLPKDNFFHYLSSVGIIEITTIVFLLGMFWLFNKYIWQIPLVRRIINIPNINGRYEGNLTSTHTENNEENGTYPIAIEISQTLTSISVFFYTERSCSYSLIASIGQNTNNNHSLMYIYQNKTSVMTITDADMRDHRGSVFFEIFDYGKELKGNYFNNPRERGRYGMINVKKVSRKFKRKF